MDRIYSSEQIQVPPTLPGILKAYTKEVIRYNPRDIIAFSRDYFAHMCEGPESLQEFLAGWERQQRPTTDNQ